MKVPQILYLLLVAILLGACRGDDDDDGLISVPPRDRGEQELVDDAKIRLFLENYAYNYEQFENPPADFDFQIRFSRIPEGNNTLIPLIDQVTTKTINRFNTDQNLYILKARTGITNSDTYVPTIADSTFIRFRGSNFGRFNDADNDGINDFADIDSDENSGATDLDDDGIIDLYDVDENPGASDEDEDGLIDNITEIFDSAPQPTWFDLSNGIEGFTNGIAGTGSGSGFTVSDDGTITYNDDYAIGALFIPSGLAYFDSPPNNQIPFYSSLIFTFDHYMAIPTDHDNDRILSIDEDVNNNDFLFDNEEDADNTDGDAAFNFRDPDDDNDGVLTRLEIVTTTVMEDGEEVEVLESFLDTDNDGTPNHLDTDDDGDGIPTADELRRNSNTGEIIFFDSDGDGIPDYLDADS